MDFFADNMVKHIIGEIIENKGELSYDELIWFQMTKCMFRKHNAKGVLELVHGAMEEVADDQWFENKYPKELFEEKFVDIEVPNNPRKVGYHKKKKFTPNPNADQRGYFRRVIDNKIKITQVAEKYGIIIKKGKAICPFHADTDPSLSFSDDKNVFNCFGCDASGDIVKFVQMMEVKKEDEKKREQ